MVHQSSQPLSRVLRPRVAPLFCVVLVLLLHTTASPRESASDQFETESHAVLHAAFEELCKRGSFRAALDSEEASEALLVALIRATEDPCANLETPAMTRRASERAKTNAWAGVGLSTYNDEFGRLKVRRVVRGGPADLAGILRGDTILKVGDVSVLTRLSDTVAPRLEGPRGSRVSLVVETPGNAPRTVELAREVPPLPPLAVRVGEVIDGTWTNRSNGRYAWVSEIQLQDWSRLEPAWEGVQDLLLGLRGVIIDLRDNLGGELDGLHFVGPFIPMGSSLVELRSTTDVEVRSFPVVNEEAPRLAGLPLCVLVDRNTASAAEAVGALLHHYAGAPIVGEETYGKSTYQDYIPLPHGFRCSVTTGVFFVPAEAVSEPIPLRPAVCVRDDPATAEDEALVQAVAILEEAR